MHKIIKTGEWKYSGNTYLPILLVKQEPGHPLFLQSGAFPSNIAKDHTVYYLHFGKYLIDEKGYISADSSSRPFLSVQEAIGYAERNIEILNWNMDQ
ncbi:hypothetical protein FY557_14945 [Chryseobacterium sp. SN22]|uniref:hypothetical protein n=1 Tax=Chryseobacterium sp. SN22 TaxID=2606431 RepID=UPI0011EC5626|nr:hypothetical protein [Chryseobacterium sp. SN22]KAA0127077.1 hypothetical protein FY557_14945 [Chryseobacterium sp. SN22]